ncbi:MAG: acetyl/propionyl-CoA carboxylase subunit alpha [Rhodospirillaceae bacterium]|nr:acetyl/propionyl-CoA carboxylase subunit alpha [Rhodospirillaceae bacterium]
MFKKILIANRGEIACRIIRTCRRMGIETVAVYSEADENALHVKHADEAFLIGGAPSTESYLLIDNIVDVIKKSGAQAVHPGYGFLSENPVFAEKLEKEKVTFIGPGVRAIAAMGDKIESKKIAASAGVNTVPGYVGVLNDDNDAIRVAGEIGYPVMIKASAGGGGKGMRVAYDDDELREGFRSAVSEAASSFGDDRVFVEKFIEDPRHIEIQIIADSIGNTMYLGERECSIQRRHQKVVEEAPSPFIDQKTRRAMGEQAILLAKSVDYCSAGTVEFIVDRNKNFYFLEMNTRLQVEHPVTELVTGLDLVELMILVATGEKLGFKQKDVKLNGWAIEARIYAEDPDRNFFPSSGRLIEYNAPPEIQGVRVDTGVYEGSDISMFYDPMIAKLITSGSSRDQAISSMKTALDKFRIRGVSHNIDFLSAVMSNSRFQSGDLTTAFIEEEFPSGFNGIELTSDVEAKLYAVAAAFEQSRANRRKSISGQVTLPRRGDNRYLESSVSILIHRTKKVLTKAVKVDKGFDIEFDNTVYKVRGAIKPGITLFEGSVNDDGMVVQIDYDGVGYHLKHGGWNSTIKIVPFHVASLIDLMPSKQPPDMSRYVLSPMPGLLVSLAVKEGDMVEPGQELAIVEAMKMENVMKAERNGIVAKIHATPGSSLGVDEPIIEFE